MDNKEKINNQLNMEDQEFDGESSEINESALNNEVNLDSELDVNEEVARDYEKELQEINDKYLRIFAEFENFKKRTSKERIDLYKTAGKDVIVSLLPVLDDFDRALKVMENVEDTDPTKAGLILIKNKMLNTLAQRGLKEMVSIGEEFNTDKHEAITQIPASSEDMKGKVMDEMDKGYLLNDVVIRFAKVIVGI